MLYAGIVGKESGIKTVNLIISMFSLIGKKVYVIDSKKLSDFDYKSLESHILELPKNNIDVLIFKINVDDIKKEFYKNLIFDIIIYQDKADDLSIGGIEEYRNLMKKTFSLLHKKGVAIVNIDEYMLVSFLNGMEYYVITYGFNKKASITTSSIGNTLYNNNFMCCQQRTLLARNGNIVEPQEYIINIDSEDIDPYSVLAAATFAIINDINLNSVKLIADEKNKCF